MLGARTFLGDEDPGRLDDPSVAMKGACSVARWSGRRKVDGSSIGERGRRRQRRSAFVGKDFRLPDAGANGFRGYSGRRWPVDSEASRLLAR